MAHGPDSAADLAGNLEAAGRFLLRYGLVLVLVWIEAMKFTAFEAEAVKPRVESSPLMRWLYRVLSVQGVSNLLGVAELLVKDIVLLGAAVWSLGDALADAPRTAGKQP